MGAVVADTSAFVELFAGRRAPALAAALSRGEVVLSPIVLAELVSGAKTGRERTVLTSQVGRLPFFDATRDHWVRVGELRGACARGGISVTTLDAHVAQCAIDLDGELVARDKVFDAIAKRTKLRLAGP